ncbi:MAG: response regulator [Chloroflexota bacterium]|nr:response regulator [Chloroflexota bacterium]
MSQISSILLVDDDANVRDVFQLVMKHYKLPLVVVNDAEAALDYLTTNTPDVIVLDLFLPGMDGYQALNQIRKRSLARNAKIIATTAYYTQDTEQEIFQRGFDGYLAKPIDSNELIEYLQRVVNETRS